MNNASSPLIMDLKGSLLTNDQVTELNVYLKCWCGDFAALNAKLLRVRKSAETNLRSGSISCMDGVGRNVLPNAKILDKNIESAISTVDVGNTLYLRVVSVASHNFIGNHVNEIEYSIAFEEIIPKKNWHDVSYLMGRTEQLLPRLVINKVGGMVRSTRNENGNQEFSQIEGSALGENYPLTLTAARILDKSENELFSQIRRSKERVSSFLGIIFNKIIQLATSLAQLTLSLKNSLLRYSRR